MNFIYIFKFFLLISALPLISCQSVERVIDQNLKNEQKIPKIDNIEDNDDIILGSSLYSNNFEKPINLKELKHSKNSNLKLKTYFLDNKFYSLNLNSELFVHEFDNGDLFKRFKLIDNDDNDNLVSNLLINNYYVLGFSSGKIIKVDLNGNVIWSFNNNKIFNSFLYQIDDLIIVFYIDQILALSLVNGDILWSETYEDLPIMQAKGGQLVNFFNDLYFILPNGRVGLVDLYVGEKNINKFVNIDNQNSVNSLNDKIHLFKNYLVYLIEGEFLYVYDLLQNKFLLNNFKINSSDSYYFFNNALIIKNSKYLQAVNILNGKTFWLFDSKLNKNSEIINVMNLNDKLSIFLDDGKIIAINDDAISEILDLKIKKISSIYVLNNKIFILQENGKIGIF